MHTAQAAIALLAAIVITALTAVTATAGNPWPGYQVITPQPVFSWENPGGHSARSGHAVRMAPLPVAPAHQPTSPGVYHTPAQPYAYGYFGAHPQRMWTTHRGYYGGQHRSFSH